QGACGGDFTRPRFEEPDRTFIDQRGQPLELRARTEGRLTMLSFGYTHCPDVCPVYLAQMASALDAIGSGPGSRPLVLLVAVDIQRDTPDVLKAYMARFGGQNFIGLTGDADTIAAAHDDLKFPQTIIHPPDENGD